VAGEAVSAPRKINRTYRILSADNMAELEEDVNAHLADGWRCCGGVSLAAATYEVERKGYSETAYTFLQAVTLATAEEDA